VYWVAILKGLAMMRGRKNIKISSNVVRCENLLNMRQF